jgi:hypothetical protein
VPSTARTRSGTAAAKRNTIRTSYKSVLADSYAENSGLEGEETNIELVKGSKANDDVGIGTIGLDVAKEDGEAGEDVYEENVGRRGAQSTNEENPGVSLNGGEMREECKRTRKGRCAL